MFLKWTELKSGIKPLLYLAGIACLCLFMAAARAQFQLALLAACLVTCMIIYRRSASASLARAKQYGLAHADFYKIVIISLFLGFVTTLLRNALGYFDHDTTGHFRHSVIPDFLFDSSHPAIVIYDKSELKSVAGFFLLAFVTLATVQLIAHQRIGKQVLSKLTLPGLLMAMSLLFLCTPLPPYTMDFTHWSSWFGPMLQIQNLKFPVINSQSQYGLLPPWILYAWTRIAGTSVNGYAVFLFLINCITAILSFHLVKRATRSGWFSLACVIWIHVCFFSLVNDSVIAPNLGPLRSILPALVALACFSALLRAGSNLPVYAAGLGFFCLWEPATGFFTSMAFMVYMAFTWNQSTVRHRVKMVAAFLLAMSLPIIILLSISDHEPIHKIVANIIDHYRLYGDGFSNLPQRVLYYEVAFFAVLFLILVRILKLFLMGRMPRSNLLILISLLIAAPFILQNFSRTYNNLGIVIWIMLPALAALLYRAYRLPRYRRPLLLICFVIFMVAPVLGGTTTPLIEATLNKVADLIQRNESQRYKWALKCDEQIRSGGACSETEKPSLANALKSGRKSFFVYDGENTLDILRMGEACKNNVPLISLRDIYVYFKYKCNAPGRFNSFNLVLTKNQLSEYIDLVSRNPVVIQDSTISGYPTDHKHQFITRALLDRGFRVAERCGKLTVLRANAAKEEPNFCGQPTRESSARILSPVRSGQIIMHRSYSVLNMSGLDLGRLPLPGEFTMELVVKPGDTQVESARVIGDHGDRTGYALQYAGGSNYYFVFGAGDAFYSLTPIPLAPGLAHYLAITRRDGTLRAYVDGKEVASTGNIKRHVDSKNSCFLGNTESGSRYFQGEIREVRLSASALTPAEVGLQAAKISGVK